jgi:hypothetical protein
MSAYGTKRNRLGAHGISGAEGRPAVPSTFDGDIVIATKKGVNPLERGGQVDFMADFQEMLDFPPAPKLDILGKLDPTKATQAETRGQEIFFGKGQCASCHQPPFYTDNLMHNLQTERFFKPVMINNMMAVGDGPIKTFPLRGTKDNPPYLHDERLLTLEDTVEFFNLILGTKLAPQEKQDLVAFCARSRPGTLSHRRKARRIGSRSWATCQWPWAKLLRRLGEPLRWPQISGLELLGEPAMANLLGCPNRANPSASEQSRPRAVRHSGPSQRSVSSGERMLAEGSSKQLPLVIVPRRRPTVQRSDPCYE